jgi:hypothetical protein
MKRPLVPVLSALVVAFALGACEVGAADRGAPLALYLDGSAVLVLKPGEVSAPLDLFAALGLAPEDVRYAELNAPGETPIRTNEPHQRYPKRILAAFPAAGGVGAGWVDRVHGKLPTELQGPPPVSFAPATEVRLRTLDVEHAAGAVPNDPLLVLVGDARLAYTSRELEDLPREGPEKALGLKGGRQAQSGVPLANLVEDALERSARTLADVAAVTVRGPGGELRFGPADFAPDKTRAGSVKRNRKGLWRIKVWEREGEKIAERDGLRGIDSIEITLR